MRASIINQYLSETKREDNSAVERAHEGEKGNFPGPGSFLGDPWRSYSPT